MYVPTIKKRILVRTSGFNWKIGKGIKESTPQKTSVECWLRRFPCTIKHQCTKEHLRDVKF